MSTLSGSRKGDGVSSAVVGKNVRTLAAGDTRPVELQGQGAGHRVIAIPPGSTQGVSPSPPAPAASLAQRLRNTAHLARGVLIERQVPFWPAERLERLQRERVRAIVAHAYQSVPFYRRAMDERGLRPADFRSADDLARLPRIDGNYVRTHLDQFVSTSLTDRERLAFTTSGTLDNVMKVIYWDTAALLHQIAYQERDRVILARLVGRGWGQRQVQILFPDSSVPRLRGFWDSQTIVPPGLARRGFISLHEPFSVALARLNRLRPDVIYTYGSYADRFFRVLADRGLRLDHPCVWVYGGDGITSGLRELAEERFGCPLYSTYGTTETLRLGFQCERRHGFHLNTDLCAVRVVGPDGGPIAAGESGDLIVSNLHNRAMVLLNYRLGDRGVWSRQPCPCGRSLPLLERLDGRIFDRLTLPDGREIYVADLEFAVRTLLRRTLQFQVVALAPGRVIWRIVPPHDLDLNATRQSLIQQTQAYLGMIAQVEVEFLNEIPLSPAGKALRVLHFAPSVDD